MRGTIASLWRHPVKGLTPEQLSSVRLEAGKFFPSDRKFAVEVGPSGFDPANPQHITKQRFTVLARFPTLARLKTRLDDATGKFHIGDASGFGVEVDIGSPDGRAALERFLQAFLGEEAPLPLRVLEAPQDYAFMDSPRGWVSVINLASVRAVEQMIGLPVDPLRFRANIYVEGWPAWAEDAFVPDQKLTLGGVELSMVKPIVRCVATHVNLESGARDIDMLGELRKHFGRDTLGNYVFVDKPGEVRPGDAAATS